MAREIASEAGEKKRKEEKDGEGGPPATASFPQVVHHIAGGSHSELEMR